MKYHIVVYGCQMNISDAERVSAVLGGAKYKQTQNINEADLIIVAMCSVRQSAVNRVHGLTDKFKTLRRSNPHLKTILTGCVLKRDRKKFSNGFDYIVDIKEIYKLPGLLLKRGNKLFVGPGPLVPQNKGGYQQPEKSLLPSEKLLPSDYFDIAPKYSSKFSANVPIVTGCNNFCSYCVVPYVREGEVSRSAKEIISEIKHLIKDRYKEIWLLGQNVNSYKDGAINFPKLLEMTNNISGNFWIRFTSSHPKDFSKELIDAMANCKKVTPYLNLAVQSGDNKILKSMNRHYTIKEYQNKIKELRKKIPDISLSTDIIVGFPGETKKQFENTAKLLKNLKYDMAYINKYSPRAGTAAFKLKDNVSIVEKKRREKILTEILKKTALEKNGKYINKTVEILVESKKDNKLYGRTKSYKLVQFEGNKNLIGKFIRVKIINTNPWKLTGNY